MTLKDFSIEDKIKFFDFMYQVGKEEYANNGEDPPNHDLGYWLRDQIVRLVTSRSKTDFTWLTSV